MTIAAKVKLQLSADYETSDTPSISYTNIQGDVLELTFFSPEMSYNGQYKVNGKAVDLNTEYISKSDYMQQKWRVVIVCNSIRQQEQKTYS